MDSKRDLNLMEGYSSDQAILDKVQQLPLLDMVLIDGGHTYDVVMKDIQNYLPRIRVGGYLIIDDCGNSLDVLREDEASKGSGNINANEQAHLMPAYMGWPQVTQAVDETLPPKTFHAQFEHKFAVWTIQVWKKVA